MAEIPDWKKELASHLPNKWVAAVVIAVVLLVAAFVTSCVGGLGTGASNWIQGLFQGSSGTNSQAASDESKDQRGPSLTPNTDSSASTSNTSDPDGLTPNHDATELSDTVAIGHEHSPKTTNESNPIPIIESIVPFKSAGEAWEYSRNLSRAEQSDFEKLYVGWRLPEHGWLGRVRRVPRTFGGDKVEVYIKEDWGSVGEFYAESTNASAKSLLVDQPVRVRGTVTKSSVTKWEIDASAIDLVSEAEYQAHADSITSKNKIRVAESTAGEILKDFPRPSLHIGSESPSDRAKLYQEKWTPEAGWLLSISSHPDPLLDTWNIECKEVGSGARVVLIGLGQDATGLRPNEKVRVQGCIAFVNHEFVTLFQVRWTPED